MIRMADGPVANIPSGFNAPGFAVAGYVNRSGIGVTFPAVVARFPTALHLSITTDGSRAMCADVEKGAMTDWSGYDYGYCSVSDVNALIAKYGRPKRLWTAHYDPKYGAHICSPTCWPGLATTADGTQWADHGGWDESLLNDNFFTLAAPIPNQPETEDMDNLTFIRWAYLEYLVREPDAAGYAADNTFLANGGSRNDLIANLVDSPEGAGVIKAKRKLLGLPT